jgi:hypothetical protein
VNRERRTVKSITKGGITIQPVFVDGPTWEYRANFQARKMCPPVIMCKYCLNPVITGFKCAYCECDEVQP